MRKKFDYTIDFKKTDFRKNPELYTVGIGEQGVLLVEPYKSEILKYWKFKTPEIAKESSEKIYGLYLDYKKDKDFVGMDMARKFIQMGYTRSRRYANHKSGRKWSDDKKEVLPYEVDNVKAESAKIFYEKWQVVKNDPDYIAMKDKHIKEFEKFYN